MSVTIKARRIFTPYVVIDNGTIVVEEGKIAYVGKNTKKAYTEEFLEFPNGICIPGFIDLHVHGGGGGDFSDGTSESFTKACIYHAKGGTTSILATLTTEPFDQIIRVLKEARHWIKGKTLGAEVIGVHVEGPFLNPEMSGAQPTEYLEVPKSELIETLLEYSDVIKRVTIAPELKYALDAIKLLSRYGILCSIGHSKAHYDIVERALLVGLKHATHLYNAMGRAYKKGPYRIPGTLESVLSLDGITAEIIADGHHVHPALIRMAIKAKGYENVCLVTDAMRAAGMPDGTYRLGSIKYGTKVIVKNGISYTEDMRSFASTTITMIDAVRTMIEIGYPPRLVFAMASTIPAKIIGISHKKGSIKVGLDGDIVVLDKDLKVLLTMVKGKIVYQAECIT